MGAGARKELRGKGQPAPPYRGGGVGLGPVRQQDVDDVRVALLGGLVQRRVAVLQTMVAADRAEICKRRRKTRLAFILNFLVLFTTKPSRMPASLEHSITSSPFSQQQNSPPHTHLIVC